jgi:hypothetical protein
LLIETVERHGEVPASITELYDRFFDHACGRYDESRGISVLFDYAIKRDFLSRLAYIAFFRDEKLVIDRRTFDGFVIEYARKNGWEGELIQSFVGEIERAGILRLDHEVEFAHRSFHDYFAASGYLDTTPAASEIDQFVADTYLNSRWRDVAFFVAGIRRKLPIEAIVKLYDTETSSLEQTAGKFTAPRLMQAAWMSETATKTLAIERSVALLPILDKDFRALAEGQKIPVATMVADFFLRALAEYSLSSKFLLTEITSTVTRLVLSRNFFDLKAAELLMGAVQSLLPPEVIRANVTQVLEQLVSSETFSAEEKSRIYWGALLLEGLDDSTIKAVRQRLKRILGRHPQLKASILDAPTQQEIKQLKSPME